MMKDHEIRETINELRDIAIKYHDAQQLRERIAHVILPMIEKLRDYYESAEWGDEKAQPGAGYCRLCQHYHLGITCL